MKQPTNGSGYKVVGIRENGKEKLYLSHRLVMETFSGSSELQVNHRSGVKTDNNLSNLEYVTCSENIQHAYDIGIKIAKPAKGEAHWKAKLTEEMAKAIKYSFKCISTKYLAEKFQVSRSTINYIRGGKLWKHI